METRWRIELFGGLRLQQGDQVLTRFRTQKTALLLAYLAYYRQRTHPRDVLVELLWPEGEVEAGRHRLSVALSALRTQLEPPGTAPQTILVTDRFSAGLRQNAFTTDVAEFEAALSAAKATEDASEQAGILARAVDLYRGPLLAGYYEDWVGLEQQRWEEIFFRTLHQLIATVAQEGDHGQALQYALRAVSADPLREETHRAVMRLFTALGQPTAALRQYHDLQRLLKQELGRTPSADTRALVEEIGGSSVQDRPTTNDQRRTTNAPPLNAPFTPSPPHPLTPSAVLEPVGGAVPLDSPFYVVRDTDAEFRSVIARRDSIVLIKGARETGKTSLLARGLQQARESGARVVLTDFRTFNAMHLQSAEAVLLAMGETIGEQLDLEVMPADVWDTRRGPNPNFRRYLRREVLGIIDAPLVWGLDGVDRLFDCDFCSEVFGLMRSWHNDRALDPAGPWAHLTLIIAYATEAHLFITDANQSPFNVGTRLTLRDFTLAEVADLNARHQSPLEDEAAVTRYYHLVGGHPYLVRRGLYAMATHGTAIADLEASAVESDGLFADHLRRIRTLLARGPDLSAALQEVLHGSARPTPESFYRLRSAGLVLGNSARDARPRCGLYATFIEPHLR